MALELRHGMSREEIESELRLHFAGAAVPRLFEQLVDAVFSLATVERLYRPAEVSELSAVNRRVVLADLSAGKFGDYYSRTANQFGIPASAINAWRESFKVRVNGN
jgi:hypothetical protein